MRAVCQICGETYGIVEIEGYTEQDPTTGRLVTIQPLRYPLSGGMIGSPDRAHGYPDPFDPSLDWEPMRCPYGRIHRPMVQPDLILTHKGMVRLPKDGSKAFLDPTAKSEVDRDSVTDRTMQVPDDVAEKMAREALQPVSVGVKVIVDGDKMNVESFREKVVAAEKEVSGVLRDAMNAHDHAMANELAREILAPKVFVSDEVPKDTILVVDMANFIITPFSIDDEFAPGPANEKPYVITPDGPGEGKFGKVVPPGTIIAEDKDIIAPLHVYKVAVDPDKSEWICAEVGCDKRFDSKQRLQGHMGWHAKQPQKGKKRGKR